MYEKIVTLMKTLGDTLPARSGKVEDIGIKKAWLTEDDTRIEREFQKLVKGFGPGHTLYAEEINDEYIDAENIWVLDPISSTFSYIHGLPFYTIVIAHLVCGEVVFGAVYDPSRRELFTAEKGEGAYLNESRIYVSEESSDPCLIFNPSTGHGRFPKEINLKLMNEFLAMGKMIGQVKNFGSYGLHYAYIASGRAEAAISLMKDTSEFAGKILVEEAGGVFTPLDGGEFGHKTSAVLACNKNIFPELFKRLAPYF